MLGNKCRLTVTHPSTAGRVTTDWNEDDVGGEGGEIVARWKDPKSFLQLAQCRPQSLCLTVWEVPLSFSLHVRLRVFWLKEIH